MDQRTILIFLCTIVCSFLSLPLMASNMLTPALFEDGKDLASANFACPDMSTTETSAMVYCRLSITTAGTLDEESISCSTFEKHREFAKVTPDILKLIKFSAASIKEIPTPVRVSMRVIHTKSSDKCAWTAVLNNGLHRNIYGSKYVAPQEVIEADSFMREYARKVRKSYNARTLGQPGNPYVKAVNLQIDTNGKIKKIQFEPRIAKRELKRILRSVLKSKRFIPGQSGGNTLEMETMLLTGGESVTKVSFTSQQIIVFDNE